MRTALIYIFSGMGVAIIGYLSYMLAEKDLYASYQKCLKSLEIYRNESEKIVQRTSDIKSYVERLETENRELILKLETARETINSLESVFSVERKRLKGRKK